MTILQPPSVDLSGRSSKRLLIHNWRTAGTSTSSLLACNFGSRYLKIGLQFNSFGLPELSAKAHQITQLGEVRAKIGTSRVIGGHLFAGLSAFLPGNWELWMTARDPIKRAKSGVLRFHGRPYRGTTNPGKDLFSYTGNEKIEEPQDLFKLFDESLRFERNGMCRRLSVMQLAKSIQIKSDDNLEKIPELSLDFKPDELYESARITLDSVKLILLTEYYTASVLCLEQLLGQGPLICPFSDLKLNGRKERHALPSRQEVVDKSNDVLAEIQAADLLLWKDIKKRFRDQLEEYKITRRMVAVRDLLQSKPLLNPQWFLKNNYKEDDLVQGISFAIAKRAKQQPELADDLIDTIASWQRFSPETGSQIRHYFHKSLQKMGG